MPAIWNLHHEHCRIFQGHTFIGCVFSVGPRGFAPIGPSKFARGKGCKSHSLDWSEEKMKKAPCRFSKNPCWGYHIQSSRWFQMSDLGNSRFTKRTSTKFGKVSSLTTRLYKRDVWQKLGGFASRKIMYVHRCDTTFTVAICAIWNCPIACVMICGSNGHAAEAAEATNLWSQRIRKKKPCLNVHHLSGLNAGRNVNLEDIITSTWSTGRFEPSLWSSVSSVGNHSNLK